MFATRISTAWWVLLAVLGLFVDGSFAAEEDPTVPAASGRHDWPTWRYDSGRSARVPHELADELHLQWVRQLRAPRRAWPEQHDDGDKLAFDRVYEPVAAEGRLYVASDDGHLVCLDARSGALVWRFRAAPSERMVLGNERLISTWPVRGAPVVHDGTVYLAAGIWPFEGVYVYALNAETAEVISQHSGVGDYAVDAYGGEARSFSTLAPQGYLAVAGDRLIVAGGRTTPAVFDRQTGELLRFHPVDKRRGGYAVFAPEDSGATAGYALLFGIGSGRLLDELLLQSDLHVVAFDPDAERVARFRRRYGQAGLYGTRVAVRRGDARTTSVPPYIASLIVSEDLETVGLDPEADGARALFEPLRPYGGVAWLPVHEAAQDAWTTAVQRADLAGVRVQPAADGLRICRAGPLPGAGVWAHPYADAANSGYSTDDRVRAPLGVAWFGGPSNEKTLPRHMNGPVPQVVAGRLILLGVHHLSARCAFTGRELWAKELPGVGEAFTCLAHEERYEQGLPVYFPSHQGASFRGSPYVSTPDSVYVLYRDRCLRIDLETGQTRDTFRLPDREHLERLAGASTDSLASRVGESQRERRGHISVSGDSLIATAYPHRFETKPAIGSLVTPRASSAGRAHIRYSMPGQDRLWHWNDTSSEFLLAMDRHTDEIRWVRQARYGFRHNADGTVLWHRQDEFSRGPLALHAAQRRILPVSLDIVTGEPVERENPVTGELEPWSFAINKSCGTRNVSRHLMTFRSSMASYHDLQHESGTTDLSGVRAGCTNNMITADGVLNVPDYTRSCSCAYQLQTSFGLVPMPDIEIRTISTYADPEPGSIRRVGINFGAPGTRIADGLMWINYPRRQHVAAPRVVVQVETVDERLDIVRAADGPQRAYVAEFRGVATEPGRPLVIEFPARDGSIHPPLLCGVETRLEE